MTKKVVIDPQDYKKLVDYIRSFPVPFDMVPTAVEVRAILEKAMLIDIEIKEPVNKK